MHEIAHRDLAKVELHRHAREKGKKVVSGYDIAGVQMLLVYDYSDPSTKLLGGKGKVLLLRYQEGVASTEAREQGFVVDTGSEQTVITRPTAQRLGVLPITQALSAGVGDVGLRGLQLARIDSLEVGEARVGRALIRIEAEGLLIFFERIGGLPAPFELLPQFKVCPSRGGVEAERLLEGLDRLC